MPAAASIRYQAEPRVPLAWMPLLLRVVSLDYD